MAAARAFVGDIAGDGPGGPPASSGGVRGGEGATGTALDVELPRAWLIEAPQTDPRGDGYAYGEAVLVDTSSQPATAPPPSAPESPATASPPPPAVAVSASDFRCLRHPACIRGFKHGGRPGACCIRTVEETERVAHEQAEAARVALELEASSRRACEPLCEPLPSAGRWLRSRQT